MSEELISMRKDVCLFVETMFRVKLTNTHRQMLKTYAEIEANPDQKRLIIHGGPMSGRTSLRKMYDEWNKYKLLMDEIEMSMPEEIK